MSRARRRRRRKHGCTEPLERERGHQSHPVDLGLRAQRHALLAGLSVEVVTERRPRRFEKKVVVGELRERDPFPVGQAGGQRAR